MTLDMSKTEGDELDSIHDDTTQVKRKETRKKERHGSTKPANNDFETMILKL